MKVCCVKVWCVKVWCGEGVVWGCVGGSCPHLANIFLRFPSHGCITGPRRTCLLDKTETTSHRPRVVAKTLARIGVLRVLLCVLCVLCVLCCVLCVVCVVLCVVCVVLCVVCCVLCCVLCVVCCVCCVVCCVVVPPSSSWGSRCLVGVFKIFGGLDPLSPPAGGLWRTLARPRLATTYFGQADLLRPRPTLATPKGTLATTFNLANLPILVGQADFGQRTPPCFGPVRGRVWPNLI